MSTPFQIWWENYGSKINSAPVPEMIEMARRAWNEATRQAGMSLEGGTLGEYAHDLVLENWEKE